MNGMKRMDKEKFIEAYNGFVFGGLSLEQAAKVAGRSVPTIRKYFSMVLTGQSLPKDLFIEGEKEWYTCDRCESEIKMMSERI